MTVTHKGDGLPPSQVEKPEALQRAGGSRFIGLVSRVRELGLLAVLLLIVVVVGIQVPRFLTLDNIVQILLSISLLAIVAVGETVVVLTRNVDLSVGSIVGLTAYVAAATLKSNHNLNIALVILLGCGIGLALGAINGLIVAWGRVPSIVATLGTLYAFRGLDSLITGGGQVGSGDMPDSFLGLATTRLLGIPVLIIVAALIALLFAYLLRFTRTGRQFYAVGSNPDAARLAGLRSSRLVLLTFLISGLLCGLAGVLWTARYGSADGGVATGLELEIVSAVVVGGVNIFGGSGTILGAMLGTLVLGTIDNALTLLHVNQFWLQAIEGAAIIGAVTLDAFIMRWIRRRLITRRQR